MGKIRNFLCFLYVLSILIVRLPEEQSPTGKLLAIAFVAFLYILAHRRNDVDSNYNRRTLPIIVFPAIFTHTL